MTLKRGLHLQKTSKIRATRWCDCSEQELTSPGRSRQLRQRGHLRQNKDRDLGFEVQVWPYRPPCHRWRKGKQVARSWTLFCLKQIIFKWPFCIYFEFLPTNIFACHCAWISGGIRTHNLQIISLFPYPLEQKKSDFVSYITGPLFHLLKICLL